MPGLPELPIEPGDVRQTEGTYRREHIHDTQRGRPHTELDPDAQQPGDHDLLPEGHMAHAIQYAEYDDTQEPT